LINITMVNNNNYFIRFSGKKKDFNDYINMVIALPEKSFSIENKCWIISTKSLAIIKNKVSENLITYTNFISLNSTKVDNYQDIGKDMKLIPYDYQKEAIKFSLDHKNALIIYPCGSGKTPIGIGIYLEALSNKIITGPGMIIVKASLKTQWLKEISKFSDLTARIVKTPSEITLKIKHKIKRRQKNLQKKDIDKDTRKKIKVEIQKLENEINTTFVAQFKNVDLLIMNYETLNNADISKQLHKLKPQYIFGDEIQYIKSRTAKRSKSLYEFKDAKMKIGATATPITKDPEDLFGIFNFVNPEVFRNWNQFSRTYVKWIGFGQKDGFKNQDKLKEKIADTLIVKTKEDISGQLPSLIVIPRYCDLAPQQQRMSEQIMDELDELKTKSFNLKRNIKSEKELNDNEDLAKIEAKIMALQTFSQEIADSVRLLEESESTLAKEYVCKGPNNKLEMFKDIVEEIIESGEKVTVFSKYKRMQPIFTEVINEIDPNIKIAYVNGSIAEEKRYEAVYKNFTNNNDYKILLMSDAGAEGINLSACKYLIEYDLATSYAIQTQRHGRIERADSIHDTVFVYQLIANNSWDIIQQKIIEKKEKYDFNLIKNLTNL